MEKYIIIKLKDEVILSDNFNIQFKTFFCKEEFIVFQNRISVKYNPIETIEFTFPTINNLEIHFLFEGINLEELYQIILRNLTIVRESNSPYFSMKDYYYGDTDFLISPNLFNYFKIPFVSNDENDIQNIINDFEHQGVLDYYYIPKSTFLASPTESENIRASSQPYLTQLGLSDAWAINTGKGDNVRIIDVEKGWFLDNIQLNITTEQIIPISIDPIYDANVILSATGAYNSNFHGQSVLSILKAIHGDTPEYSRGIAPNSDIKLVPLGTNDYNYTFHSVVIQALILSLDSSFVENSKSAIILLELCLDGWLPLDFDNVIFEIIKVATQQDVNVIIPSGNGGTKLIYPSWMSLEVGLKDSGGIYVGATKYDMTEVDFHEKRDNSNYGERINCFCLGENINTLFNTDGYTTFDSTSAAAAIVAGLIASIQSYAITKYCNTIPNYILREWFTNNEGAFNPTFNYNAPFNLNNLKWEILSSLVDNYPNP